MLKIYQRFLLLLKDPLYMNSLYMMISTAVVSGSGFFFWMLAAHLYRDVEVGLATALISVITFIMNFSILGLNYSLIRFLPKSKSKNSLLSGSFSVIALASVVCGGIFLAFLPFFSPPLVFVRGSWWSSAVFLFFCVAISIDFAMESVFLGLRSGKYILLKNILVSLLKLLMPVFFVSLGAMGLFLAWALSLSSALVVGFFVLFRKFHFRFRAFTKKILAEMVSFSAINFLVGLLGIAPGLVIPILITNTIAPETTAYFYVAFMIANLLYTIPYATTQSLFAEGSHDEANFLLGVRKAFGLIGGLLVPGILFLMFLGNYILLFFGKSYSSEGVRFLQILALAGIPVSINYIGLTFVNVKRRMGALFFINCLGTGAILLLSYVLRSYSLTGIGLAWLGGHVLKSLLYSGYIYSLFRRTSKK
jgi:O-antigen/teichoic acid export membrane protein